MKDNEFFPVNELWPQPEEEAVTLTAAEDSDFQKRKPPKNGKAKKKLIQRLPGVFVAAVAVVMLSTAVGGSPAPDSPVTQITQFPTQPPATPSPEGQPSLPDNAAEVVEWSFAPFGSAFETAFGGEITYGDIYTMGSLSISPVYYQTKIEVDVGISDAEGFTIGSYSFEFDTGAQLTEEELSLLLEDVSKFQYATYLYMERMNLTDISFLSKMTMLDWIRLNDNQITDVTPLADLTRLEVAELSNNLITDIALPTQLNLRVLDISNNQVQSTEGLGMWMKKGGNLHITMSNNLITALSGFEFAEGAEEIGLTFVGNQITDISGLRALAGANKVSNLNLSYNQISDLSAMAYFAPVFQGMLDLSVNQISDLAPLADFVGATNVVLSENSLQDISPLEKLVNVQKLSLGQNQITDISPLSGMTQMVFLDIRYNSITDISALSGMTVMEELVAFQNAIVDISPLAGLTGLEKLYLSENAITDISPLAGMTGLTHVDIRNNSITDYSPIEGRDFFYLERDEIQ